jgi:hypothetical protein
LKFDHTAVRGVRRIVELTGEVRHFECFQLLRS